jgi:uncharacterized protein (DUF488 family)
LSNAAYSFNKTRLAVENAKGKRRKHPHVSLGLLQVASLEFSRSRIAMAHNQLKVWTIGHSTRSIDEFIGALRSFEIQTLADVRSFPGSRRYPQFNQENLRASLTEAGIGYIHLPDLGGRRRARSDSLNMAWQSKTFRGYADYMETEGFQKGIARLLEAARELRTAIMCAEAVWWRCHRSLISDYLKANEVEVTHIMATRKSQPHPFTSAASIVGGKLSYRGVLETED